MLDYSFGAGGTRCARAAYVAGNRLHLADKAATPLPFSNHVHYCNIQSLRNEIAANKLFTLTF